MRYILAIDQGTTGSRAVVYDRNGDKIASSYAEFTQYFPRPGWVEHEPEEIWESVNSCIKSVIKKVGKDSIAAIGITNQRETTVIWDRDTGRPIYRAIVWQCRRTAERCKELKREKAAVEFFRKRTGLPIDAYFSATKIEWILRNVPGALSKAKKGRVLFGTTDTWILWRLTAGKAHATDYTNASRTMLFNIDKLKWDSEILRKFNIPESILPEVKPSSCIFGKSVKTGNLPADIPISGIAGDQQSALFGQACFKEGMVKNTYGTGSFILLNTGNRRPESKYGLIVTIGCGVKGEVAYALEGAIFITGAAVQWLRDGLGILKDAPESEKMALSVRDTGGVYFVPALVGLGAPYWDQDARGGIFGITRGTKREHIARASLEAICYQTKDVLLAMQKDSGVEIKSLRVDGGAAANNFLCQFQSDILGIEVVRPKTIEITSLGAAYLAGLAVGYWKDTDEIERCWKKDRVFKPNMTKEEADRLYEGWLSAVKRTIGRL